MPFYQQRAGKRIALTWVSLIYSRRHALILSSEVLESDLQELESKFPASVISSDKFGQTIHFRTNSTGGNSEQGHLDPSLSRTTPVAA